MAIDIVSMLDGDTSETTFFSKSISANFLIRKNAMTTCAKITRLLLRLFRLSCFSQYRKSGMIMFKGGF